VFNIEFNNVLENSLWGNYANEKTIENRNDLITFYYSLIKVAISKLIARHNKHIDYDDLISCGTLGLIDAIEKFDSNRGVKFETYASIRIRGTILDQLRKQDWLPSSVRQKVKKVESAYDDLEMKLGRPAKDEEVAEYLNMDSSKYNDLLEISHTANIISLDDGIINSINDYGKPSSTYDPENNFETKSTKDALVMAIDSLSEKERLVVSLYYYDELTLKEIGVVLGVSESRVCQIHSKVLIKLKAKLDKSLQVAF